MRVSLTDLILMCCLCHSLHVDAWRCSLKVVGSAGRPAERVLQDASMNCGPENLQEANSSLMVIAARSILAHNESFTGISPTIPLIRFA